MVVLSLGTDVQVSSADPVLCVTAFVTDEVIGPFLLEQVIVLY